jgi:type IV secretory pathway VirB4 component
MALPLSPASKQDMGNSLDLVDVKEIKQSAVIVKDGSLRQVIMVGGVNFSLKSEVEQNIITQGYQTFLNGIDFPLQILIHSRKVNIEKYIGTLTARKDIEQSPILQNQIDEYSKFIEGFVQKNAIMEKVFLVVVSFYATSALPSAKSVSNMIPAGIPFFGKKKENVAETAQRAGEEEKIFSESVAQLGQRTSQIMSGLLNIGLEATLLDDEQLVELFYNFYNPQTIEREKAPAPRE